MGNVGAVSPRASTPIHSEPLSSWSSPAGQTTETVTSVGSFSSISSLEEVLELEPAGIFAGVVNTPSSSFGLGSRGDGGSGGHSILDTPDLRTSGPGPAVTDMWAGDEGVLDGGAVCL